MEEVKKDKKVRKQKVKSKASELSFEFAQNLNTHLQNVTQDYLKTHEELIKYISKDEPEVVVMTEDIVDEVNDILNRIQNKYIDEVHPILNWIATHYEMAVNMANSYEQFINQLEKQGAKQIDREGSIIMSTDVEAARNRSPLIQ